MSKWRRDCDYEWLRANLDGEAHAMGHEYCGVVEEVGSAVKTVKPGQFAIGSFCISDNTCHNCQAGYQSGCQNLEFMSRAQAPMLRVPLADDTLVATPEMPTGDLLPSLLTISDVLETGWFAVDAANVKAGSTAVVVGDAAVGLLGVLSVKQMGAELENPNQEKETGRGGIYGNYTYTRFLNDT